MARSAVMFEVELRDWIEVPILGLLAQARPATIGRFVIAVAVDAVDAVFGSRFASHVGEKVSVVVPTLTDRNALTAIELIIRSAKSITTSAHRDPSAPFWSFLSFTMGSVSFNHCFAIKTSARFTAAFSQGTAGNKEICSAIAVAKPALSKSGIRDGEQASETLICEVKEAWHAD